jgi:cysteine desulfuration protein SufE
VTLNSRRSHGADASREFWPAARWPAAYRSPYRTGERTRDEVPLTAIDTIREDFASLDDWEDRYRYVIELGHTLEPLGESARNSANKVRGCVSQVWLECEPRKRASGEKILHYRGDSDSHLVRGLIAIAIALFSDLAPAQILSVDALSAFRALGLEQHLTPQRSNGVRAMVERIRADAAAA